jgi:glutamine synthetase
LEEYIKKVNIEALTMIEMAKRQILPACIDFATELAGSINNIKAALPTANTLVQESLLASVSDTLCAFNDKLVKLERATSDAEAHHSDMFEQAKFYRDEVFVGMGALREESDKLESMVDATIWPLPTYADMLFNI